MELNDLKTTWQSVSPRFDTSSLREDASQAIKGGRDIRSRFRRRMLAEIIISTICLVLMATSGLWSPTRFQPAWLLAFCAMIVVIIACSIHIRRLAGRICTWKDTNSNVFAAILGIKRTYRNMELAVSLIMLPLLVWLAFTPPFFNARDIVVLSALTVICFSAEYLWYRSNIRQLNRLSEWFTD